MATFYHKDGRANSPLFQAAARLRNSSHQDVFAGCFGSHFIWSSSAKSLGKATLPTNVAENNEGCNPIVPDLERERFS